MDNHDDHLVASIVHDFFHSNIKYPTLTKLTASFNIVAGLFRVCCVCGKKKDVLKLANQFHKDLIKEIEHLYKEDSNE